MFFIDMIISGLLMLFFVSKKEDEEIEDEESIMEELLNEKDVKTLGGVSRHSKKAPNYTKRRTK